MQDITDEIVKEKLLRDFTRSYSDLLFSICSVQVIKKENKVEGMVLQPFKYPQLVEFVVTGQVHLFESD